MTSKPYPGNNSVSKCLHETYPTVYIMEISFSGPCTPSKKNNLPVVCTGEFCHLVRAYLILSLFPGVMNAAWPFHYNVREAVPVVGASLYFKRMVTFPVNVSFLEAVLLQRVPSMAPKHCGVENRLIKLVSQSGSLM